MITLESLQALPPNRRLWLRFKNQKRGYWSLWILAILFLFSAGAELFSNDKPLLVRYQNEWRFPLVHDYSEKQFGGDFDAPTDYLDPFIRDQFQKAQNWAWYPLNHYHFDTVNYFAPSPNPAPPSAENWLGTDDRGRDVLARLIYGFRLSIWFALALTTIGTLLGILMGALQGYFAGKTDLLTQRLLEIWGSMPELFLLLIFASMFEPSLGLLLILLSLFGWLGLSDYVRADFLRTRQFDYVLAARALGLSNRQIIWRHILPNSLTSVVTFLPFRMSGAILALTGLDFLGLGVPESTASLGELLAQGKNNLDAWWIVAATFLVLTMTLFLLTSIGDALRNSLDIRRGHA